MVTGITLIMLILATQALDSGYLARTPFSYALQVRSSPAPIPDSMTLISDDPSWWPLINSSRIASYFAVAASAGVTYDWVLTIGQEIELMWVSGLGVSPPKNDMKTRLIRCRGNAGP